MGLLSLNVSSTTHRGGQPQHVQGPAQAPAAGRRTALRAPCRGCPGSGGAPRHPEVALSLAVLIAGLAGAVVRGVWPRSVMRFAAIR